MSQVARYLAFAAMLDKRRRRCRGRVESNTMGSDDIRTSGCVIVGRSEPSKASAALVIIVLLAEAAKTTEAHLV